MTEYGRGQGSEPWHPDDPLYGDGGWDGQQAQGGQQSAYGGQPQQHYPEQQQYQQHYGNGNGHGGWDNGHQDAYAQQQYQQEYGDPGQQYPGQQQPQHHQQYTGHGEQQYGQGNGGWNDGTAQHPQGTYAADPNDPYGGQQQAMAYGGGQQDFYGTPDAYPPPEPPARRGAETRPAPAPEPEAETQSAADRTDWDPGPDQGEHAFFAGGGGDDEDDEAEERAGRGDRKGRGGKSKKPGKSGKKRRSGCACLVVVMVFGGGFAGVSYFGYQFFQSRFGEAPDYSGNGTNETVTITVAKGEFGSAIGQKLKAAGVVKSVDAFTAALAQNPDRPNIQAGVYLLKKEMSAESAITLMLDPKSQNNFTVREGERNSAIYVLIDKELGLKKGTTEDVAGKKWESLGLPKWANDNDDIKDPLEGFLYPSTYPVSKDMKPEQVLKELIALAKAKYEQFDLAGKAKGLKLENPLQVLTVASLVQAEGNNKKDYKKIARVVYNRLEPNNAETAGLLDFDSTVNYLRGESKLATGSVDSLRQIDDPYNTYKVYGLPPGPIGNPGDEAIEGALKPAKGDWYYFVSINEDETLFAVTNEEHNKNRRKYQEAQNAQ
ncbi:endolytic transglycosylase MltG [Streptomyces sp. 11x1]|uniref:endolytic transglycosylase MltG n=1 Tax=Streptomyces sp. 11x1 TaxID=3038642 RepID=UPI00292EF05C|nr:endolytic transglycosylase MltG [Streptomyces sp. 11x1]WNZ13014.1 endolytic transglycosylase MltG [Streptomyces sp. 11x1]